MKNRLSAFLAVVFFAAAALAAAQSNPPPGRSQAPARDPSMPPNTMLFDPALLTPSALNARAPATFDVKFVTTKGEFVVHVIRAWAPLGADRFYNLVQHHYFDGNAFFRVLPGFIAQFGLSGYPEVNKAWANATFHDDPVAHSNTRGTITFATAGANTRTTQLFINFSDRNAQLDRSGFSPFGEVISGMDVVEKLYSGYGEGAPQGRGPDKGRITSEGRAYLERGFPNLDVIKTARIVPGAAPAAGR